MDEEPIAKSGQGKSKLGLDELIPFVAKLLENLIEDTIDGIEALKQGHLELRDQSAIEEMDEKTVDIDEKRLKTMFKVLYNVPLVSYHELEHQGFPYPLIQMQVLQQQVYNLCGYHMSHTLMNFVNYFKSYGKTSFLENINSSTRYFSSYLVFGLSTEN